MGIHTEQAQQLRTADPIFSNFGRHSMKQPELSAYEIARQQFPFFQRDNPIFMENAGGSQVPACVGDSVREHLLFNNAQLGAGHAVSNRSTDAVTEAHNVVKTMMNAHGHGEVVLMSSSSQLFAVVADAYRRAGAIKTGDEIVILESAHEANAGPWVRLAQETGAVVKWWRVQRRPPFATPLGDLKDLLSPRTRIVAVPHVSNILGEILDVPAMMEIIRSSPAGSRVRVAVDGVAYAPHQAMDVAAWGVDWYGFSLYKTWGPHLAALYGSHSAFDEIKAGGPNHFFVPADDVSYKFELGGPSHEACAGVNALSQYFKVMAGVSRLSKGSQNSTDASGAAAAASNQSSAQQNGSYNSAAQQTHIKSARQAQGQLPRADVEDAYRLFQAMEQPLQEQLVGFLLQHPGDFTVVGPQHAELGVRVPTISFVSSHRPCAEVTTHLQKHGIAMRNGHMYAARLIQALAEEGIVRDDADGVVRISLLHYNMPREVDIEESSQQYRYTAELPGLSRQDIKVEVDRSRRVCISGKRPPLHATDYGRLHNTQLDTAWRSTRERQPGTFRRAWMLPEDANVAAMHAFVRHGILVLTIEKIGAHQSSEAPHT